MLGRMKSVVRKISRPKHGDVDKPKVELINGDTLYDGFFLTVVSRQESGGKLSPRLAMRPFEEFVVIYGEMKNPPENMLQTAAFKYKRFVNNLTFDENTSKSGKNLGTLHVDIPCCMLAAVGFLSSVQQESIHQIATLPGLSVCRVRICILLTQFGGNVMCSLVLRSD